MFWNTPEYKSYEAPTFKETVTGFSYDLTEDEVSKYWYNKGHEDGRKLVSVKEITDEEKWEVFTNLARSPDLRADMIRFADSILRKAQEK